ncbi:unnamed protein product [Lactuca virosa]|uniref:Uncharacterized protein n=1 Tax=Lactuca virosa TaxID=75947 RepID=A0AAU9MH50_9ASTR|nr:unnamed protein product [Lactuca virosa]
MVKKFSREICSWVLERYDEKRNVIRIKNKDIHISRRGVHHMYGLPMGDIPMNLPKKSRSTILVIRNWRNQFSMTRIRLFNPTKFLEKSTDSDKLKEDFSNEGYENVEVIKKYEEFVDDAKAQDSETETETDHADKGEKFVEENINEEQVRNDVPIFVEYVDKGKKFVQDNINDNETRDDDWMDIGPSVPRFDIILIGSKSLEDFKEKIDFLFKSYSCLKPTIDDWINRAWNQFPCNQDILKYDARRNVEFKQFHQNLVLFSGPEVNQHVEVSKELSNVETPNEDVHVSEELRDVQLDQLLMT